MEKEKSQKIQMVYGYAVCIVAVITLLISVTSLVYSVIDLSDPFSAYKTYNKNAPSLASFDNYKVDIIRSLDSENELNLNDPMLMRMYDSAKQDAISKVKHEANRSIIVNTLIILITIILFITHWIWMKNISKKSP
jgi:hypothetical protein